MFHPKSPYYSVCADVIVRAPGGKVEPHEHQIPQPQWVDPNTSTSSEPSEVPLSPDSDLVEQEVAPVETELSPSSPVSYLPWLKPSSRQVLSPSGANPLGVLQVGQNLAQLQQ